MKVNLLHLVVAAKGANDLRPHHPHRAQFRDFHEEIFTDAQEKVDSPGDLD